MSRLDMALRNALLALPAPWPVRWTMPSTIPCPARETSPEDAGHMPDQPLATVPMIATAWPLSSSPSYPAQGRAQGFVPACRGDLLWQGFPWICELDSLDIVCLHPALRHLPPAELVRLLPAEVLLTALEVLLEPLLRGASDIVRSVVTVKGMQLLDKKQASNDKAPSTQGAAILLEILLDAGEGLRKTVRCRLTPPQADAAYALLQALPSPRGDITRLPQELRLPVSVLAGHVRLPVSAAGGLAPGDILMPDELHAARGLALLRLPATGDRRWLTIPCTLQARTLTVDGPATRIPPILHILRPEHTMSTDKEILENIPSSAEDVPGPETAPALKAALEGAEELSVELTFELERRAMTLAEIAALTPGSVLTLGADINSPVTLRIGECVLGTGRLVDVEGVLGVQVVALRQVQK